MSLATEEHEVILGVDTHLDVHVAVLIDEVGRVAATHSFPTTASGYEQLIQWAGSFGRLSRAGVEGTGAYGAGLARHLQECGVKVLEINRPDRSRRRLRGKSDPTDAENAARAVLAGDANAIPKAQSGVVEAMRAVNMARRSAVKAKTQAINQLRALLVTAPAAIRAALWKVKPEQCVARCARLQSIGDTPLLKALTHTLRLLARRWLNLAKELRELDAALEKLAEISRDLAVKLADLNRRSFRWKLRTLASRWGVPLNGISDRALANAIKARNRVIHRGQYYEDAEPGDADLWTHVTVIREIVVRFIFTIVGYRGKYYSYMGEPHDAHFPPA